MDEHVGQGLPPPQVMAALEESLADIAAGHTLDLDTELARLSDEFEALAAGRSDEKAGSARA